MKSDKPKSTSLTSLPLLGFLREVQAELYKVTWPDRPKVIRLTIIVIIISAFFGLYLGALDVLFTNLMSRLIELTN